MAEEYAGSTEPTAIRDVDPSLSEVGGARETRAGKGGSATRPLIEGHELLFDVRRSIRYHTRRRMFFERYNLFTNALSVIFGSAAILAIVKEFQWIGIGAAALVTVFSAINLVVGSTRMARLHEELSRKFIELEKAAILCSELGPEECAKFFAQRLDIEAGEPAVLRVLDSLCHNEMMRAMGYNENHPDWVVVGPFQRLCAHLFDWHAHKIVRRGAQMTGASST